MNMPIVATDSLPGHEIVNPIPMPVCADSDGPTLNEATRSALSRLNTLAANMGATVIVGFGMSVVSRVDGVYHVVVYGTAATTRRSGGAVKT